MGFLKNVSYMYAGQMVAILLALISTPIYIRYIGLEGFAIIGIVHSFFHIVLVFDLSYFLSLVKYNSGATQSKQEFQDMFNTLYSTIIISNVLLFGFFSLMITVMVFNVYKDTSLLIYFFLALPFFIFLRASNFLQEFVRANNGERINQVACITNSISSFLITLFLIIFMEFGVASVFVGTLVGMVLEFIIIRFRISHKVNVRWFFSPTMFIESLKKYGMHTYIAKILLRSFQWGALFLSTFFFEKAHIGILTIFISLMIKVKYLLAPIHYHLITFFSGSVLQDTKSMLEKITYLLLVATTLAIVMLITVGKYAYMLYYGDSMTGTYHLFLYIIIGVLLHTPLMAFPVLLYAQNIKRYNRLLIFLTFLFFLLLVPMMKYAGLAGIAITYFIIHIAIIFAFYSYTRSSITFRLSKASFLLTVTCYVIASIGLWIHSVWDGIPLGYSIFILLFSSLLIFMVHWRRVIRTIKEISVL